MRDQSDPWAVIADLRAERDALRAALFGAHQDQEVAEARLAAVEALCDELDYGPDADNVVRLVRAAARGEGL